MSKNMLYESLDGVFPKNFSFFSFGNVILADKNISQYTVKSSKITFNPVAIVKFSLLGDEEGEFILGFNKLPAELSILAELGNILAAKFTNQLSDLKNITLNLSPPQFIDPEEKHFHTCKALIESTPEMQTYFF